MIASLIVVLAVVVGCEGKEDSPACAEPESPPAQPGQTAEVLVPVNAPGQWGTLDFDDRFWATEDGVPADLAGRSEVEAVVVAFDENAAQVQLPDGSTITFLHEFCTDVAT
jgi:hypothetical protein